jgi:hypothetical protein
MIERSGTFLHEATRAVTVVVGAHPRQPGCLSRGSNAHDRVESAPIWRGMRKLERGAPPPLVKFATEPNQIHNRSNTPGRYPILPYTCDKLDGHQLVFICGIHRSGTSLLHQMIKSHPLVSGFTETGVPEDEGQHLQTIFPTARALGGPGRFGFHPAAYMDNTHPLATAENANMLFGQWARFWDLQKPTLIEKSPPTIIRTRFFQALFSQAKFIFIFRNPIAVAYATRKWCKDAPFYRLIDHTLTCYHIGYSDMNFLKNFHVVRYEDLIQETTKTLQSVWHFLNIEYSHPSQAIVDANVSYLERWKHDRNEIVRAAHAADPLWLEKTLTSCRALGYPDI